VSSTNDADFPLTTVEFVALAALLTCLTALSIDIMLPVLPQLADGLGVENPNDRQWIVTSYLGGLVVGQMIAGSLSDRFGRLPVLFVGLAVFIASAALASFATSFSSLLAARCLQGIGGAAPRIITMAVVRDRFAGRQMARIMSLVMTTFIMVPVFAPSLGQLLAAGAGWRAPLHALTVVGVISLAWAWLRLPETSPHHRRASVLGGSSTTTLPYQNALMTVIKSRTTVGYILANGCMFGCLMGYILSSQQIFVDVYDLGAYFPLAFGLIALAMALAGILNSRIVVRLGMRDVSHRALFGFLGLAIILAVVSLVYQGRPPFWFLWSALWLQFFCFGLIVSNFNAISIEPLGKVAGTASSIMGSYTTLSGALLGAIVGQAFDMTAWPINVAFVVFSGLALIIVLITERGRLFTEEVAA